MLVEEPDQFTLRPPPDPKALLTPIKLIGNGVIAGWIDSPNEL